MITQLRPINGREYDWIHVETAFSLPPSRGERGTKRLIGADLWIIINPTLLTKIVTLFTKIITSRFFDTVSFSSNNELLLLEE